MYICNGIEDIASALRTRGEQVMAQSERQRQIAQSGGGTKKEADLLHREAMTWIMAADFVKDVHLGPVLREMVLGDLIQI